MPNLPPNLTAAVDTFAAVVAALDGDADGFRVDPCALTAWRVRHTAVLLAEGAQVVRLAAGQAHGDIRRAGGEGDGDGAAAAAILAVADAADAVQSAAHDCRRAFEGKAYAPAYILDGEAVDALYAIAADTVAAGIQAEYAAEAAADGKADDAAFRRDIAGNFRERARVAAVAL